MTSNNIVSVTKHKYKWKPQEIGAIVFFVAVFVALAIFTNATLTASMGSICLAIAAFLVYIGFARKKASELTANVFDDGSVQVLGKVTGQEYEENNRVVLKDVVSIKWEKYAHHPTLRLSPGNGPSLILPRRVAEEEPLNTFIRENLSKKVYVVEEAKATLSEILEENPESATSQQDKAAVEKDTVKVETVGDVENTEKAEVVEESHPVTAAIGLAEIEAAEKTILADTGLEKKEEADSEVVKPSSSPASDLSNLNSLFADDGIKFEAPEAQKPLHDGDEEDDLKIVIVQESPEEERKVQPRKRSRPKNKD